LYHKGKVPFTLLTYGLEQTLEIKEAPTKSEEEQAATNIIKTTDKKEENKPADEAPV
jgi:hypothetical protein